tara:strand:- start:1474 stop:2118 length:645 start_codon:yes stop_codon:yes gene_type:complete
MSWTFTTLKSAIQDYTQNTESTFVSNLPTLIVQAENRIIKSLELPNFRKNVTGTLTASNPYLSAPSDYLYPFSLAVLDGSNNYEYLLNKDVSFIRQAYPSASTTGTPKFYAQFDDDTFIVAPTPSTGLTVELHYFYKPESITVASSGTTWLGTNATEALLYGSLVEAYTFMKGEPDILANYENRFKEALGKLTLESDGYNRKDAFRDGQRKVNV